jgi:hypothetical protein
VDPDLAHIGSKYSSWGYHSDGKKCNDNVRGEAYGPPFTAGDIIGCGVNYAKQEVFFTLNGALLGTAFRRLSETVYPTIGLHSPGELVIANFGQNVFRFDVQQLIAVSHRHYHIWKSYYKP